MPTEIKPTDTPTRALALQLLDIADALHTLCSTLCQDKHVSERTREKAANLWHVLGYEISTRLTLAPLTLKPVSYRMI